MQRENPPTMKGDDHMPTATLDASHRISEHDGKVTIHDLELFVGFDPSIDDEDDERIRKYDADRIAQVVERTQAFMARGQHPRLIPAHNSDDEDAEPMPAIGDIVSLSVSPDNDLLIIGDVVVPLDIFETKIRNNTYPRRSSEIWRDGYLSEVTLLGSKTPARPLPDTRFKREGLTRELFFREMPTRRDAGTTSTVSGDDVDRAKAKYLRTKSDANWAAYSSTFETYRKGVAKRRTPAPRITTTPRKEVSMYPQHSSADLDALKALKAAGDYVAAAKFARAKAIPDEQFDKRVPTRDGAKDSFGRPITRAYGDDLIEQAEKHDRQQVALDRVRDACTQEGITDPVIVTARINEALAKV